jgi:hypothetical protein
MRVNLLPFAGGRLDTGALAIVLGLTQPVDAGLERTVEDLDLMVFAFNQRGDRRGTRRQTARLVLRPSESGTARYEVLSRLDLPPGRYNLRLAIHASSTGKSGSVYHEVEIPDYSKPLLSLSGVVLGVEPRLPVAPRDFLASLTPVVPTTQRSFATTDRVSAFVRAYQGGKKPVVPIRVTTRIVDERDQEIIRLDSELAAEAFGPDRRADVRLEVPVERLSVGSYLLTIDARRVVDSREAGTSETLKRVRFVVR